MFLSILNWCKKNSVPPGHKSGRASCPGIVYSILKIPGIVAGLIFPKKPEKNFVLCCEQGDIKSVRELPATPEQLSQGMSAAIDKGQQNIVECLIQKGYTPTQDNLATACKNNRCEIAEMIIAAGRKLSPPMPITAGLRVATSNNIIRMLYRYEQGSENL